MGILYPDNNNRADRVNQLVNDIVYIQEEVRQAIEAEAEHDKQSLAMLESMAKKQNFETLDEYIADVEKQLSPEDRKQYQDMKAKLTSKDGRIDLALKTGSIEYPLLTRIAMAVATLFQGSLLKVSLQAIGVGLLKVLVGQFTEGLSLLSAAGNIISTAFKGKFLSGKVLTAFKVLRAAGVVLSLFGLALNASILIYEAVDGAKQRTELQKQSNQGALSFSGDMRAILDHTRSLQELVDEGVISQKVVDGKVQEKMVKLEPRIKEALNKIDDESTYKLLEEQDKSRKSWTTEDPSFTEIEKMIAQYEQEEK
ncbi:hypothetical protein AMATHDRAFT_7228 [Amanita thiersii Skay4041]|uniref:Uncharacterized protein n=1 Tax=Amanita thiersii Skay4041 TaxID=703135 RepID=A0A2A9NFA1_9AGAR|nr:hypothetical protein AMATHDRAFT_7228 [Amanita thiersii Skay4041]